ncbi:MAG: O-antigen ligase family protein [Planctomycetaceae bacterium]
MLVTLLAFLTAMITTGMSSAIAHPLTIVGGSVVSLLMAAFAIVRPDTRVYGTFVVGSLVMTVLALVSAQANYCVESSTFHVLCCYLALLGMGFSSVHLTSFCKQLMLMTNLWLTAWVVILGTQVEVFEAWKISNPAGAGNQMAAQINMTMPMVIASATTGGLLRRSAFSGLVCLNVLAVFLVMSRNGIATMLILLALYFMFNYKRWSVLVIALVLFVAMFPEYVLQNPTIRAVLVRFRFLEYDPTAPRSVIWEVALQYIREQPFLGVGPGRTRVALAVLDINHAHNNWIQVAIDTGLPSACLYLLMTIALLILPASALFRERHVFLPTLGILAYFSYSMTAGPVVYPNATLLLAACVNQARVASDSDRMRMKVGAGGGRSMTRGPFQVGTPGFVRSAG